MININLLPDRNILVARIQKYMQPYLEAKIEKLNKKAIGFGLPPMELTFGPEKREEYQNEMGYLRVKITLVAKLVYDIPVIDGWELICTFDVVEMGIDKETRESITEVFATTVPNKSLPVRYHEKKEIHCDHCGHNRFRNHSMLMRNIETGEYKEVGSTCIKDFFGHNPRGFMMMAKFGWLDDLRGEPEDVDMYEYQGKGYRQGVDNLKSVLTMTSACIREFGWVSYTAARENSFLDPTGSKVTFYLNPPRSLPEHERIHPTDDDRELAEKTIEYFKNLTPEEMGDNDYLINANKCARYALVPWKLFGLACSMINSYQRVIAKEIEREKNAKNPSEFQGSVGDRLRNIPVTCLFQKEIYSDFGTSDLYIMMDEAGNKYKTFYAGSKWSMEQKDTGVLTGTVKDHEVYNDEKSTMLTRCVVTDIKDKEGVPYGS